MDISTMIKLFKVKEKQDEIAEIQMGTWEESSQEAKRWGTESLALAFSESPRLHTFSVFCTNCFNCFF
ncbi:hypothetical protein MANES_18G029733v8 [Manihot esculenta]|uniref:Uncharacterized protein n=1 Tax=Manihot esculenta TaxID=3983 RepID=A0ACB7FXH5_MANES|nr:hypothetical protein MANES_18G029733v8 [Manihot esculenta]